MMQFWSGLFVLKEQHPMGKLQHLTVSKSGTGFGIYGAGPASLQISVFSLELSLSISPRGDAVRPASHRLLCAWCAFSSAHIGSFRQFLDKLFINLIFAQTPRLKIQGYLLPNWNFRYDYLFFVASIYKDTLKFYLLVSWLLARLQSQLDFPADFLFSFYIWLLINSPTDHHNFILENMGAYHASKTVYNRTTYSVCLHTCPASNKLISYCIIQSSFPSFRIKTSPYLATRSNLSKLKNVTGWDCHRPRQSETSC